MYEERILKGTEVHQNEAGLNLKTLITDQDKDSLFVVDDPMSFVMVFHGNCYRVCDGN